jgi:hypothetical protein
MSIGAASASNSVRPVFGDLASEVAGGSVPARSGSAFLFMPAERAIAGVESAMRLTLIANGKRFGIWLEPPECPNETLTKTQRE